MNHRWLALFAASLGIASCSGSDAPGIGEDTIEHGTRVHPMPTRSRIGSYLVARVLAYALEHGEGIELTRGLSVAEEPALWRRDLRGDLTAWIEIGAPSVERLHRASKTGARVVVYTWKQADDLAAAIAEHGVHRAAELELHELAADFLDEVAAGLDRNNRWELAVTGGTLYLTAGGAHHECAVRRVPIG